ncbi:MAG: DUF2157 domain-containing protein, partial [Flavobacterium sp.]
LNNLTEDFWFLFVIILAATTYYFYKVSYQQKSVSLFVFTLLYAFIGANISFYKIIEMINLNDFFAILLTFSPFYFIGFIYIFIKMIKKFNTEIKDDSIR